MMADPSLQQLEREVEAARAKLNGDLSTLRSPAAAAEFSTSFKHEAIGVKNALLERAKSGMQSSIEGFIEELKGRAAANPAAALAIGAGIAWRLVRHPPIATVLIGTGLFSLFRTDPTQLNGSRDVDYLASPRDNLFEQATDAAHAAIERTAEAAEAVSQKITDAAVEIGESAQRMTAEAMSTARDAAGSAVEIGAEGIEHALNDAEARDKLLLGMAGLAVMTAVGIAWQRRASEQG
jgi:hypothetical protein